MKRKSYLPPAFRARCPSCGYEDVYSPVDAVEEGVYTYTCPICGKRFFVAREPPLTVRCPHCGSLLRIEAPGKAPRVIKESKSMPPTTVAMALLGAVVGAAGSRDRIRGAIAGGMIGALLGAVVDALSEPEAEYIEG